MRKRMRRRNKKKGVNMENEKVIDKIAGNVHISEEAAHELAHTIGQCNKDIETIQEANFREMERIKEGFIRESACGCSCQPRIHSVVLNNMCPIVTMAFNGGSDVQKHDTYIMFNVYVDFNILDDGTEEILFAVKDDECDDVIMSAKYKRNGDNRFELSNVLSHGCSPYFYDSVQRVASTQFRDIANRCGEICSAVWHINEGLVIGGV